jgi:cell division protein FtsL
VINRLNLILLGVLILCALALVTSQHRARKLYVELQQALELEKKYDMEWNQLQLEQGAWSIHARIEKIAAQNLRMRTPAATRTQVVPAGPAPVVQSPQPPNDGAAR